MGDPASSAFQVVFQMAANFLMEELRLARDLQKVIQDLKNNAAMINMILNEADKFNPSQNLQHWLDELRDVGYEAIDILEDQNYELQRQKSVQFSELRNKLSIINPKRINHRHDMSHKIKEVSLKMSKIFQGRINFGLNVNESSCVRDNPEITSSLPPSNTVGRENEKNDILKMLIPNDNVQDGGPKLLILAIHGMGRIGKTTLAQLIYNDKKVQMHFETRLWVHVSHEFDLEKVTRSILESVDDLPYPGNNLDNLQKCIQEKLKGKKYLLVLDNFWNENTHEWEKLIRPLHKRALESVIIVTTRTELVAEMVSSIPYRLKTLSENDCYSLVKHYASCNDVCACDKLYLLRSEIFKKCGGMPEEAIDLCGRLCREYDIEKWNEIIENWGERHIFPEERIKSISTMRVNYSQLPSYLKPCLSYCSIIPRGLVFEKEWVVQLWMAQNFIVNKAGQRIEDVGNSYFSWLVDRSFFQRAIDHNRDQDRDRYSIPDMIHKLAQHTSAGECCIFEHGKPPNLTKATRHMSIVIKQETQDPFTEIYQCKGLYTLIVFGGNLITHPQWLSDDDIINNLGSIHSLDLSNCNLALLPSNIGDLKHLHYLQLRNTNIQELPESISNLYNLQTLGLRNCFNLRKLPTEMRWLQKLQHVDLHLDNEHSNVDQITTSYENLESMPPHMGLLTNLQVLSRFVVGTRNHCGISELMDLNSLQGELSISNLDLVKNPVDAEKANLQGKKHIKRLQFLWRRDKGLHDFSKQSTRMQLVLENLKPNITIEELNIVGFTGERLPSWIGSGDLSNLRSILLSDCSNCILLQPLGNLPRLQDLHMKGMHSLKYIDCDFCGSNPNRFPALKKLVIENMANLEKWTGNENCKLSDLNELVLKDCAKLQRLTHNFPSLTKLTIENMPSFLGLHRYPSLQYLKASACDNWIWGSWPCLSSLFSLTLSQLSSTILPANLPNISIRSLEISHCNNLTMMPDDWIPSHVTSLCIRQCPMLRQLPKGLETHKILEDLEIQDCKTLEFLPELKHLKSLTRLEISGCHSFAFLPREGLPHALHFLSISDCPLFSKQFQNFQSQDRIKIQHVSSAWIDQKHLTSIPSPEFSEASSTSRG